MPLIILGGIYGGIFTPTEAASVAVIYAILVSLFVYRSLKIKDIFILAGRTGYMLLTFMLIFVFGSLFSRIMTMTNMTPAIIEFLTSLTQSRVILLLLINLFLLIIGMVMDAVTGIILVVPLFFPLATGVLGLNPVHFGAMVVTNLAVGMITPPMAGNLFVAMRLTGASLAESIKDIIPFVLIGMIVVMVVTFIPGFSMGLLDILK
jgi:C4-dicarboxylate transporter DctM subunit